MASDEETLNIEVVALQWKWLFIYPQQGVASVNEIAIPVNRAVKFTTTAQAPMSAFWIPALGSMIYSMEGMSSIVHLDATKEGTYTGYNTNINGEGYSDMTFKVKAVSNQAFNSWVDNTAKGSELDMPRYQELAKPSKSDVQYFKLGDSKLFEKVVAQYMRASPTSKGKQNATSGGTN